MRYYLTLVGFGLLLIVALAIVWPVHAEKYGDCLPQAAGACGRLANPSAAEDGPAKCTPSELYVKTTAGGANTACFTPPCLCFCDVVNHWTCLNAN